MRVFVAWLVMANPVADSVHLVRVITDDREHQLWVAATSREDAVTEVLNAIPEGWAASLLTNKLSPVEVEALNLRSGEVREITLNRRQPDQKAN
jgi:hypothetical protein